MLDLEPAAHEVIALLDGVADEDLGRPTPCPDTPVAAMLDHMMGLSLAFTLATRRTGDNASAAPSPSAAHLDPQWRTSLPRQLGELVQAWRVPTAWEGMASAGGVTMPAPTMGLVALDELVLHGWDLARATGQPFRCDEASTAAVLAFTEGSAQPENAASRTGLFGPVVPVADDAPAFDRALGFAGRDPSWTSTTD